MNTPKLTIGIPVYNGEKFIARLLDSILAQTFTDFEVKIFDNGSTDGASEICQKYAAEDARFHYIRHAENFGATYSFNRCAMAAESPYFAWAAHDDYWMPSYAEKCLNLLEAEPKAVLAYSRAALTDDEGRPLPGSHYDETPFDQDDLVERYGGFLGRINWCTAFYGIIRHGALQKLPPFTPGDAAGDNLILAQLCLLGPLRQLDEALFIRHQPNYKDAGFGVRYGRLYKMGLHLRYGITLPFCAWIRRHCQFIRQMNLDQATKNQLVQITVKTILTRYQWQIEQELNRAIDLIESGQIYKNWEDELDPEAQTPLVGSQAFYDAETQMKILRDLEYAVGLAPNFPRLNYARAVLLARLGRQREAALLVRLELEKNPNHLNSILLMEKLPA